MKNQQFLRTFQEHLLIAGPKRVELLAEVQNHVDESSPEHLGDPKQMAHKLNRVHLGIFSSLRQLILFRLASFFLLEIGLGWAIGAWWRHTGHWSQPLAVLQGSAAAFLPLFFLVAGAFAISRMHRRWIRLFQWILVLTATSAGLQIYTVAVGNEVFATASFFTSYLGFFTEILIIYSIISAAIMLAASGRDGWLPKHPIVDILVAAILQAAGALVFTGLFMNAMAELIPTTTYPYEIVRSWIDFHPYTIAITLGATGGLIETFRLWNHRKMTTKN